MRLSPILLNTLAISFNPRICKRCDPTGSSFVLKGISFNPRICKRCDAPVQVPAALASVSIHASVKDATCLSSKCLCAPSGFNPRICKRCDDLIGYRFTHVYVSIHASVKDATCRSCSMPIWYCFNPRICKRCDSMFVKSFIDDTFKL